MAEYRCSINGSFPEMVSSLSFLLMNKFNPFQWSSSLKDIAQKNWKLLYFSLFPLRPKIKSDRLIINSLFSLFYSGSHLSNIWNQNILLPGAHGPEKSYLWSPVSFKLKYTLQSQHSYYNFYISLSKRILIKIIFHRKKNLCKYLFTFFLTLPPRWKKSQKNRKL